MSAAAEPDLTAGARQALGCRWRAAAYSAQESALPSGSVVVSCSASFGTGGLGRHLQEVIEALHRRGAEASCICGSPDCPDSTPARRELYARFLAAAMAPPARVSPAWRALRANASFDARAARRLPAAAHLLAFNGQALAQLRAARRAGLQSVSLMSANAHLQSVLRQHALAHRQYPLERSWATRLLRRNLAEYTCADHIYVSSEYARDSFLAEGVAAEALSLFPLTPAPRYQPDPLGSRAATFDIVYVGGLSVAKGVPLLIDALRRLPHADLRLVLVGGPQTRSMGRYLARACVADRRIDVRPGDPLPALRAARLYVHATYTDGFGYAPAEALACGLPVIVSEDTGMKELIDPGRDGLILPTGDLEALTGAIESAYRGEILGG